MSGHVKVGEIDARIVDDKTIKYLVGHSNNTSTKDAYYAPAQMRALRAAANAVPVIRRAMPGGARGGDAERRAAV